MKVVWFDVKLCLRSNFRKDSFVSHILVEDGCDQRSPPKPFRSFKPAMASQAGTQETVSERAKIDSHLQKKSNVSDPLIHVWSFFAVICISGS